MFHRSAAVVWFLSLSACAPLLIGDPLIFPFKRQLGGVTMGSAASGTESSTNILLSKGNVYVAGSTSGSLGATNAGSTDIFLAKWNYLGTLEWVRQIGTAGNENGQAVAADSSGNVYVTGSTSGALGEANGGLNDLFVAKWNAAGTLQWVKQLGSVTLGAAASANEAAEGLGVDASGNIYLSGSTTGNLGEAAGGAGDLFLAKMNAAGTLQWIRQLGSVTRGSGATGADQQGELALDSAGDVYVGGYTTGALGETNAGNGDAVVAKWSSAGTLQWVRQLGSVTLGAAASGDETVKGIAVDASGSVVVAGTTSGSLAEGTGGANDGFAAKWNTSGTLQWVRQLGGVSVGPAAAGSQSVSTVGLDSSGNVYMAGTDSGSIGEPNAGGSDIFLAKLDPAGWPHWIRAFGSVSGGSGATNFDLGESIAIHNKGICLSGGTLGSLFETNAGNQDIVVISVGFTSL